MKKPQISIVIPLYNEMDSFSTLVTRLNELIKNQKDIEMEVLLIDDGSTDHTAQLMIQVALVDEHYHCVFLSRNYGHQIALSAGLEHAIGTEAIFVLDGDLQDPPELFPEFYKKMQSGFDVIYAVRKKRKEGLFKRMAYHIFYRIQRNMLPFEIPLDSGDFSLLSRKVVDLMNQMPEESRYIRGLRAWIGLNQIGIEYERDERIAGNSKYSYKMLAKLAFDGIFNFTEIPIKTVTALGFTAILFSLGYLGYTFVQRVFFGAVPEGFTGLLFTIILFSGVQLVSLGIFGEYILRIFFQVKKRPLYVLKNKIINKQFKNG